MKKHTSWFQSACTGIVIGLIISLIMSAFFGEGAYLPVNPLSTFGAYYIQHFSNLTIMALSTVLWGMIGLLFYLTSKIFEQDWSLLRMTLTHFGLTALGFTPLAILAGWFLLSVGHLLTFFIQYAVIYGVIYVLQYRRMKHQVAAINQQLKAVE